MPPAMRQRMDIEQAMTTSIVNPMQMSVILDNRGVDIQVKVEEGSDEKTKG